MTTLGSDDDNTIGTTRTIDGGRRSILQYVDAFNFRRGNIADTAHGEAINDIKR